MSELKAPLVVPVQACRACDGALVGGKAANLGELAAAGLPVPDGFVVTTRAYALVAVAVDAAGRAVPLADPARPAEEAAALRAAVRAAPIPPDLAARVTEAYDALGAGPVAVRSSATAEDLPGATFAGQQDTYLGVSAAEGVLDAVRRCWASLWTDRAVAYRARLGIDPGQVRIAVVVQRMVDADVAGVMFTANPVTGARSELVVDASPGLGEAVVSGEVTPDHFVADPAGRVRSWRPGVAEAGDTPGAPATPVPPSSGPVLSATQLQALCALGVSIAAHFGRPQDIEWAYSHGKAWILQARPMTALPPPPERLNPIQRVIATVLGDYVTVRPYPIDMTTWVPRGPVGMMAEITADLGITGMFEGIFHETDQVVDGARIPMPRPHPRLLAAPVRLLRRAARHPITQWREDPRAEQLEGVLRELDARDVGELSWPELLAVPARALDSVRLVTWLRKDYLPAAALALARLVVALRLRRRGAVLMDLLHGTPTLTTRANDALADLARLAGKHADTAAAVDAGDLEAARRDAAFSAAFDAWVADYGNRETSSPILITTPTLGEVPGTVLALVHVLMGSRVTPRSSEDPLARLLAHTRSPRRRERLCRRVDTARRGVAFREDTHVLFTRPMPALRRALLEIGRRLTAAGVLADPEEVYHCRLEELVGLDTPHGSRAAALTPLVAGRATRRAELDGVAMLNIQRPPSPHRADEIVTGLAAGGGEATGPVRVIRGTEQFGSLRAGEVLVCPYTNPTWTPLFQRAAALVVDAGGPASHAAIVAREYGLPAVMGTGNGTSVLHDGDLVRVDGRAGVVTAPRTER